MLNLFTYLLSCCCWCAKSGRGCVDNAWVLILTSLTYKTSNC